MDETTRLVEGKRDFTGAVRLITYITAIADGYDIGVFAGVTVRLKDHFGLTPVQVGLVVGCGAAMAPFGAAARPCVSAAFLLNQGYLSIFPRSKYSILP